MRFGKGWIQLTKKEMNFPPYFHLDWWVEGKPIDLSKGGQQNISSWKDTHVKIKPVKPEGETK